MSANGRNSENLKTFNKLQQEVFWTAHDEYLRAHGVDPDEPDIDGSLAQGAEAAANKAVREMP